ncbi:hypothetical protein BGZ76_009091 [Entomortierella beljakovae]|nr:hypothetical protein BGZ76_009091 [Entomortierella beljakovae]
MDDPAAVLQDLVQQQQQQQQQQQRQQQDQQQKDQGESFAAALQFHNQKQQELRQSSHEHEQSGHKQQGFPQNESGQETIHLDLTITKSSETTQESSGDKSDEQLLLSHAAGELLNHSGHLVGDSSSVPNTEILNDHGNPNLTNDSGADITHNGGPAGQFVSSTSFIFKAFARGPSACEWIREFQCDHAGRYRDRKDPNVDPSKKRKRNRSIKCNCPAFIKMKKQFQEDDVVVEYFWRHEGHAPDALEDIKAQRIPQDLKAWIKRRALEGHDWRAVKLLMTGGSPLLDELNPATKDNIRALLNVSYSQFANTARQIKSKRESRSPSSQRSTRQSTKDEEMPLAQSNSQSTLPSSSQRGASGQEQKDDISAQTAWQLVSLNLSGDSIQSNNSNRDSQTLAIHNLSQSSNSEGQVSRDDLRRSTLTFDESLLNAEAISRVIREQVGVQEAANSRGIAVNQDITSLSLVGTSVDNSATGSSAAGSSSDQNTTNTNCSDGLNSAYTNSLSKAVDPKTSSQVGVAGSTSEHPSAGDEQQQVTPQPRDMMLQMLRAIAELHKQMELTEEYGTQEDAIEIIESFALPVRLMKEALERRSSNR